MAPRGLKRVADERNGLPEERLLLVERYMSDGVESYAPARRPDAAPVPAVRRTEAPVESGFLTAMLDWEPGRTERSDFVLVAVAVALAIVIGVAIAIGT